MASNSLPLPQAIDSGKPTSGNAWLLETVHEWVITVDHKKLGIMYIVAGLFFLLLGGLEAVIIRIQLLLPHARFVSPEVFNRMFTMHGTTMIFFVIMLILFGFGVYLVPLMIGARDMAFPRLNAWGFWMSTFGGLLLYFSFVGGDGLYGAGNAPDVGWWAYAPLTSRASRFRFWLRGHRREPGCHHSLHALSTNDTGENAAALLVVLGDGRAPALHDYSPHCGTTHAHDRPISRRPLLRHPGGRFRGVVDAFFLDLRPSRGLCAGFSGFRLRSGNSAGLFAQADFWLPHYGRSDRGHRLYQFERLGSSHFYDGHGLVLERLLCAYHHGHCRSDGNQDF